METAGYAASVFIGIALGLIGGGGSILTVPVLVYLFRMDAVLATTYSLFIVGITSVAGSVSYFLKKLIDVKSTLLFGLPSVFAVFFTRTRVLPAIPAEVFHIGEIPVSKDLLLLVLFAVLMVFASYSMIRKKNNPVPEQVVRPRFYHFIIASEGITIGMLTGLVGAGGGFLIIPVLVNWLKLPVRVAIGTSLVIISINSLTGFAFSLSQNTIQWQLLATITGIAVAGVLAGSYLSTKVDGKKLKPAFGWFVLVTGMYILVREISAM